MSKTVKGIHKVENGFSLLECMIVIAIAGILMGVMIPSFRGVIQNYRRDGVAQRIAGDVRNARARAIATGWQYRVIGFNAPAGSAYKNQYRIMARSSSAVAWPLATAAVMQSATQMTGGWVDLPALYPGVSVNPTDVTPDFWVTFDSRGVRVERDSFDPLVIANPTGPGKSVRVSAVGNVGIE